MKRAVLLSVAVICAAVFVFFGAGTVNAQMGGAVPDQPDNPWAAHYKAGDIMISEAQKTIQRCNEQIALPKEMKSRRRKAGPRLKLPAGRKEPPRPLADRQTSRRIRGFLWNRQPTR